MTQRQFDGKSRGFESLQKLLKSTIGLATALLLISLVALPYANAATPQPLVPQAVNLWPSAATVAFNQFSIVANSDGTNSLHVSATVNVNTMSAPSELPGPVFTDYYSGLKTQYVIKQGAPVRFWDLKLYVLTSGGQLILSSWISNVGDAYAVPGKFTLTDSNSVIVTDPQGNSQTYDNRWGGGYTGLSGVYATVVVYVVVQSTEVSGPNPGYTGYTGLRVLVSGAGTIPSQFFALVQAIGQSATKIENSVLF